MIDQIKNLRVEIDGLAQLTDSLEKEITCINLASIPLNIKTDSFDFVQYIEQIKNQKQFIHTNESNLPSVIKVDDSVYIKKTVDSLLLAKAWLGKCLKELGEISPYENKKVIASLDSFSTIEELSNEIFKHLKENDKIYVSERGIIKVFKMGNTDSKKESENFELKLNNKPTTDEQFITYVHTKENKEITFYVGLSLDSNDMNVYLKSSLSKIEDIKAVADVAKILPGLKELFTNKDNTGNVYVAIDSWFLNGECMWKYDKMNHIEKVDYIREKIQKLIDEVSRWYTHTQAPSRDFSIARTNAYTHLCEARFHLGFELGRIRDTK